MNQDLPEDRPRRPGAWKACINFATRLRSRPWFWLLPAAPPLITICAMMAVGITETTKTNDHQDRYLKALDLAYANEDFTAASVYFIKLREIGYNRYPNARFIGAVLDSRAGRKEAARQVLSQIAPSDRIGFRPAHLWQARELLAQKLSEAELIEARHHLQAALGEEKDEVWIRTSLAQVCMQQNDYQTALDQLTRIVEEQPELYILISEIHEKLGNASGRAEALRLASDYFLKRLNQDPSNTGTRTTLAMIYYKQGDLDSGLRTVAQGLQLQDADPILRENMSKLLIARFDEVTRQQAPDSGGVVMQLSLLQQAIEMDSDNPLVLMRLKSLMEDPDEEARKGATDILNQMLAAGQSTGTVHFILGTHAVAQGDTESARFHFQQSYEDLRSLDDNPEVPSLLNNLAWMMLQQGDNLEQALGLINQSLGLLKDNDPRRPFIRETRGRILMAMQKWPEAVTDLEFALTSLDPDGQLATHKALAKAYQQLGKPEIAAEHEKFANQLLPDKPIVE